MPEFVEAFIRDKCDERLEPKDRLHAIWLCIETPCTGSRLMQTADEKVLELATDLKVAVIIVFTKYDILFNEHHRKVAKEARSLGNPTNTDTTRTEAEARAKRYLDALIDTSQRQAQRRFECVTVSTHEGYPTRKCLHEVEGDLWVPWAAAQQINAQQKVNFSIKCLTFDLDYWINLGKSTAFRGHILLDCLSRIHLDIIEAWTFYDPEKLLSGSYFRENMIKLIEPLLTEPQPWRHRRDAVHAFSTLSSIRWCSVELVLHVVAVKFLSQKYQEIPLTARCLGAYIVDLTLILHNLFIAILVKEPPRPLTKELIADTLRSYQDSHAG
ncbi:hypothetical protein EDB83DRAFT_2385648 [Lactarius deliciosus]|nr:hypothetical protein EDB83DRAFT_2385648 [Lactarius deliciosus]